LFPGEEIHVSTNEEAIILSGRASSNSVALRAAEIAAATSAKMKVVNLLQLPGGSESQQVMLQVRLAEVSRRALLELGVSLFTGVHGVNDWVARSTTQQFSSPTLGPTFGPPPQAGDGQQRSVTSLSDLLNLFLFNTKYDAGAVIRALQRPASWQVARFPSLSFKVVTTAGYPSSTRNLAFA
jgi:Flp pilus assembly secretin CpaC